jgi:hypothetical protein
LAATALSLFRRNMRILMHQVGIHEKLYYFQLFWNLQ